MFNIQNGKILIVIKNLKILNIVNYNYHKYYNILTLTLKKTIVFDIDPIKLFYSSCFVVFVF